MKLRIGVFCGCAVWLLVAAVLHAKPGVVKTVDGQSYEGDVTEEPTTVTVKTRRVPIIIQRANIESIQYLGTLDEQFNQRVAALDAKDANGRVTIARWAFDQGRYDLARQALETAVTLEPNNRDANAMLESVRVQMRLERAKQGAASRAATAPATGQTTDPTTASTTGPAVAATTQPTATTNTTTNTVDPRNLLSADDINTIRQFELKPSDTHVRINFAKDVKKRFTAARNVRPQDFNARTPFDQLRWIMDEGTADMKRDVRIVSDPSSILEYRRSVQQLILSSCATSGCHGAAGAGGLMLLTPADNEAVTYTNFFILQNWSRSAGPQQGPFGAGERRLIDRLEPGQSLLLQYGLPPNIAEHDHPAVNGYRPVFRNRDDNGYRRVENWIGQSLLPIKPDYGITFTPPQRSGGAPSEPTTTPAAPLESSSTTQPAPNLPP